MNFSNDQYVWLNNHSSSQKGKYGHRFVVLEPRLRRSRINVFSYLGEPVWIMDQINKNIIHFLRLSGCIIQKIILGDFDILKSFVNFMKQNFHDSGGFMAFLSWCIYVFGGWSFIVHPGSIPIFGRFYLYLVFIILIQHLS